MGAFESVSRPACRSDNTEITSCVNLLKQALIAKTGSVTYSNDSYLLPTPFFNVWLSRQRQRIFVELSEQPKMGIEREELLANMRSFTVERHIVFYRLQQSQVEIIVCYITARILNATLNNQWFRWKPFV